ncbi:MAG: SusC/RagA family TonB-linked outer membrane protein [Bacteroidales bacterium]|nr:SusC/RagA family TonB-linked outer membrane protein [Bacteroidales bacterium]
MLSLVTLALNAQNVTVRGTVTDAATGEAVPATAIQVKGTTTGTIADNDGAYTISAPANATLVFSSIGYEATEVVVKGAGIINVDLTPDSKMLDETIVVAFGTSTRESFTGSATVVKSDDIQKVQATNVTRALEGMVAGVQLTTSSGSLSSSPSIIIRGIGSITAGSSPLYIVDGVPYDGDLNNINNADIESMTVLKDAASNALYGARGANGVIMITTKKAKQGRAIVTIDAKVGVNSKAAVEYDYITNPAMYYEAYYAARYNYFTNAAGLSPDEAFQRVASTIDGPVNAGGLGYSVYSYPEGQYLIGSNGKLNPNATLGRVVEYDGQKYTLLPDNWMNSAYKTSIRQEYNINVAGGTQNATFVGSFGFLDNNGIIEGEHLRRYTARLKADYQAKKWLKVGGNFSYANFKWDNANGSSEGDSSTGNIFAFANSVAPIYPLYIRDENGAIMKDEHGLKRYDYGNGRNAGMSRPVQSNSNGLQAVTLDRGQSEGNAFNGVGFFDITFIPGLKFTFNAGVGVDETRSTDISNMWYGQFATDGGTIEKSHTRAFYYNLQQILSYDKTFADVHHINAMVGHENYTRINSSLGAYKKNLFSMDVFELNGAVVDGQSASSSRSTYNNEGYFLRAQYDWAEKLFVSASYRRDASSRFHPDYRWGNFWSAGAGYLINKENWFNAQWVDMLKIKASIGSQGNDNIGNFLYTDTYSVLNSNGQVSVVFNNKGNKKISWETNTNFNAGVDFGFFNGRLSGSIEYFYRKTSDMLFWFTVPPSLGYSGFYDNVGDMRNSGVEFALSGDIIRKKNINWNVYLNGTHYSNKILYLPEERKTKEIEGYKGYASGNKFVGEGLPLNTFLMKEYAGVTEDGRSSWYKNVTKPVLDPDGNPMKDKDGNDVTYVEKEATTSYSEATEYLHSVPTPKLYGGFGTTFEAYGFDLSLGFTYSIGGQAYDSGYASLMDVPGSAVGYNIHKDIFKAWTPENTSSNIPRWQANDQNVVSSSDRFLTDASYLNFQRAQIGYTFPHKWMDKVHIGSLRIYVTCDNICYVSARKGFDPRQSFSGATNDNNCSPVRTVSGGINITF